MSAKLTGAPRLRFRIHCGRDFFKAYDEFDELELIVVALEDTDQANKRSRRACNHELHEVVLELEVDAFGLTERTIRGMVVVRRNGERDSFMTDGTEDSMVVRRTGGDPGLHMIIFMGAGLRRDPVRDPHRPQHYDNIDQRASTNAHTV